MKTSQILFHATKKLRKILQKGQHNRPRVKALLDHCRRQWPGGFILMADFLGSWQSFQQFIVYYLAEASIWNILKP